MLYLTLFAACVGQMLQPAPIAAVATAYTCEPVAANPMHPCGPLRWGGDVAAPGMACPPAWRDLAFQVPGHGWLRCDDTPRDDVLRGLPHIDVRLPSVAAALRWGIQTVHIYPEITTEQRTWSTRLCGKFSKRRVSSPSWSPSSVPPQHARRVDHE